MISTPEQVLSILNNIKLFAFDMDGVLRIGQHPVEGTEKIFPLLKKMNKESLIITNECRYTPQEILEDLTEMGVDIDADLRVLTAGQMVKHYLQEKAERFPNENISIGLIGEQGLYDTINPITQMKNVEICETPPKYKTKNFLIVVH